jgi:Uma2 family endonuclease
MVGAPEEPVFTLDDLLALPDDGRRHELLWGALVMTPAPSALHADLVDGLSAVLRDGCPAGLRVRANSGVVVPGRPVTNALAPDLYVARRDAPAAPYVVAGDVRLVVEVSLSTERRDLALKAQAYAAGGIEWYWVVRADLSIEVLHLGPQGYEQVLVARPGSVSSLPGPYPVDVDPAVLVR